MNDFSQLIFWVLIGVVVVQGALVARFVWVLWRSPPPQPGPFCPKTAVVLCLRGPDPYLKATLQALMNLDYPCYDVKIVVDSRQDPAWQVAEETVRECGATNVEIRPLTVRRDTCSLKCSSLLQAIDGQDKSYEVVALLDADTIPHRSWLSELVAPLADPRVGVATGNRWYMPAQESWGGLIRYLWNAAAVVQMFWYRIPWGGTLAIRTEALRRFDHARHWGRALCEDTMLYGAMWRLGLKVAFVPSLIMVNREGGDVAGIFRWVARQLLTARLYHPRWILVLLHGVNTSLAMLVAAVLGLVAVLAGQWQAAAWAGGGLVAYLAAMPLLLLPMELAVRRIVRARGEPTRWFTPWTAVRAGLGIVVTQVLYTVALTWAVFMRNVTWRGVSYRIGGSWKIRLIDYRPYQAARGDAGAAVSL